MFQKKSFEFNGFQLIHKLGAAGMLYADGKLQRVLPVEAVAKYEAANPVRGGRVVFSMSAVKARHDTQVRRLIDGSPVAIIVLGGDHDLSESVQRLGNGSVEYLHVTSAALREAAGR